MQRAARREAAAPAVASAPARAERTAGITWTGLIGGVMGFGILVVLAVLIAAGAGDADPLWAVPMAAFSLFFVPAVYVSVRPVTRRQFVLKVVVIGALALALAGAPVYGLELPIILAPAIGLIAQAAGFIFQGPAQRGSR